MPFARLPVDARSRARRFAGNTEKVKHRARRPHPQPELLNGRQIRIGLRMHLQQRYPMPRSRAVGRRSAPVGPEPKTDGADVPCNVRHGVILVGWITDQRRAWIEFESAVI